MIRHLEYETTTEAFNHIFAGMTNNANWIDGGLAGPNYRQWGRDFIVEIHNAHSELDLHSVGYSQMRWRKFLTEYFDPNKFRAFLVFLKERRYLDAQEYAFICSSHARHSLGNCLFGLSVRTGKNPRVTLISRSCNFIPTGVLDLSLGALVARYVAQVCGVKEVKLMWQINHLQINAWPSLVYLLNLGINPEEHLSPDNPFQANMLYAWKCMQDGTLPNEKYQFYFRYQKKIKAAYERQQSGKPLYPFIPQLPPEYLPILPNSIQDEEYTDHILHQGHHFGADGGDRADMEILEDRYFRIPLLRVQQHEQLQENTQNVTSLTIG